MPLLTVFCLLVHQKQLEVTAFHSFYPAPHPLPYLSLFPYLLFVFYGIINFKKTNFACTLQSDSYMKDSLVSMDKVTMR